jgi:methylated-DNA-[protein]-cysteine S-methyltransferase
MSGDRILHQVEAAIPPVGRLRIIASDEGIAAVSFVDWHDHPLVQDWLADGWTVRAGANDVARRFLAELRDYGRGRLRRFTVAHDHRFVPPFLARVLELCRAIPFGRTATYAELAHEAGNPRAVRAAGTAMRRNPTPLLVPCHRVLGTGTPGGYTPGLELKRAVLAHEGVTLPLG